MLSFYKTHLAVLESRRSQNRVFLIGAVVCATVCGIASLICMGSAILALVHYTFLWNGLINTFLAVINGTLSVMNVKNFQRILSNDKADKADIALLQQRIKNEEELLAAEARLLTCKAACESC